MTMIEYAKTFLGTPYVWGGNTPEEGLDCSGFVCEVLRCNGIIGRDDYNAQMLYDMFKKMPLSSGYAANAVIFYGESTSRITHVAFMINDKQIIEAGGEGRRASTKGFVRVRPYNHRTDIVASIIMDRE